MKRIKNKRNLLIIVALLSLLVLFSGCGDEGSTSQNTEPHEVALQDGEVSIDLKKYKIIRPNLAGADFMSAVTPFLSAPGVGDAFLDISSPARRPSGVAAVSSPCMINARAE